MEEMNHQKINDHTSTEDRLLEELRKRDQENKQLRRANSRLKSEVRHLKRVIKKYKDELSHGDRQRYRNKNHQGRRSR